MTDKTIAYNSIGNLIPQLQLFELSVPWTSTEGFYAFVIIMIFTFASDHTHIPLTMKIWVMSIVWFIKLIWDDVQISIKGTRLVIVPPPKSQSSSTINHLSDGSMKTSQHDALERISLIECDISITTVKILDVADESLLASSDNARATEFPSRLLFRMEISTAVKR